MRVFFFGSLMDRELLVLVIGRAIEDLGIEAAVIHGFARRRPAMNPSRSSCRIPAGGSMACWSRT
jgi:hypothetical protein